MAECTGVDLGATEHGKSGRQTGKYCSLSSLEQKRESTARQNRNLKEIPHVRVSQLNSIDMTIIYGEELWYRLDIRNSEKKLKEKNGPSISSSKSPILSQFFFQLQSRDKRKGKIIYLSIIRRRNGSDKTCAQTISRDLDVQRITSHSENADEIISSALS